MKNVTFEVLCNTAAQYTAFCFLSVIMLTEWFSKCIKNQHQSASVVRFSLITTSDPDFLYPIKINILFNDGYSRDPTLSEYTLQKNSPFFFFSSFINLWFSDQAKNLEINNMWTYLLGNLNSIDEKPNKQNKKEIEKEL